MFSLGLCCASCLIWCVHILCWLTCGDAYWQKNKNKTPPKAVAKLSVYLHAHTNKIKRTATRASGKKWKYTNRFGWKVPFNCCYATFPSFSINKQKCDESFVLVVVVWFSYKHHQKIDENKFCWQSRRVCLFSLLVCLLLSQPHNEIFIGYIL